MTLDFLAHLPPVPRETCIGDPSLIRSIVRANQGIFLAYLILPAGILRLLFRCGWSLPLRELIRTARENHWRVSRSNGRFYSILFGLVLLAIATLFAAFILACGFSHLVMSWVIYNPVYQLEANALWVTAWVSLVTGLLLWFSVPRLSRMVRDYFALRDATEQAMTFIRKPRHR